MILMIDKACSNYQSDKIILLNDLCKLKYYDSTKDYVLILNDITIDENGNVVEYDFFIEEVIITLNIICIISKKENKKIREISTYYNIPYVNI